MIEKNEENADNDNNLIRIRLITDKRQLLEERSSQVQEEIKTCFADLAQALRAREKQLLRQTEAIYRQQISFALSSQEFLPLSAAVLDGKEALEEQIKQFGKIKLRGSNSTAITNLEPYQIQEYQDTDKDHISFDKSLTSNEPISSVTKFELSFLVEDRNLKSVAAPMSQEINTDESNGQLINAADSQEETPNENVNLSLGINVGSSTNHSDCDTIPECQQPNNGSNVLSKNATEERHSSCEHPKQVQQWLEQILLETEIEPTIHEVEKLPEITDTYICSNFQLET